MPRYRFLGTDVEVFPSIVVPTRDDAGDVAAYATLVLEPGQTVDLDDPVEHARLELVADDTVVDEDNHHIAVHVVQPEPPEPPDDAPPDDSAGITLEQAVPRGGTFATTVGGAGGGGSVTVIANTATDPAPEV